MNWDEIFKGIISLNWSFEQIVTLIALILVGMALLAVIKHGK